MAEKEDFVKPQLRRSGSSGPTSAGGRGCHKKWMRYEQDSPSPMSPAESPAKRARTGLSADDRPSITLMQKIAAHVVFGHLQSINNDLEVHSPYLLYLVNLGLWLGSSSVAHSLNSISVADPWRRSGQVKGSDEIMADPGSQDDPPPPGGGEVGGKGVGGIQHNILPGFQKEKKMHGIENYLDRVRSD